MESKSAKSTINANKEKGIVKSYTDLKVYQLAFESAMKIFELSKSWRKRRYPAHFVSKLSDSDTESAETEVWLSFATHCGYLQEGDYNQFQDNYDHICRMLSTMMSNAEAWCKRMRL